MSSPVVVAGVGMVPFAKPGRSETYDVMGEKAARSALADAGIEYASVQQAYVGYIYGDSTSGQAALYGLGQTGIPIVNVNNNCSSGSTALYLARQAVASGEAECVLALGFEQMNPGALSAVWTDRPGPMARFQHVADPLLPADEEPLSRAAAYFGAAGQAYLDEFGVTAELFARVSVKARSHAARNPFAVFRDPITVEEVLASPKVAGPLTRLMCCPPTCGSAAAVVCTPEFARAHGIENTVAIRAQALTTDTSSTFDERDMRKVVGYDMTAAAAAKVYDVAGIGPQDVDVVELHDCFASNEVLTYEGLGLTEPGTAEKFVLSGDNTFGGRVVTNPSGGLLSKGHPIGATGLAQCFELVQQLRGQAGDRQVDGARVALQHNLGLGGACVVALYEKA
jgi:acetyl-CoA acetyltransferase